MKGKLNDTGLFRSLEKRKLMLSFIRSYAVVIAVPFLLSLLFYFLSVHEVNASAVRMNSQVLESASNQIELSLTEIDNVAHEIVTKQSVRQFQWKSSGFTYPNSYKLIEVRGTLDNYALTHDSIDDYFLLFGRSGIVMNNSFIYTVDAFFDQYFSLPGMSAEDLKESFAGRTITAGLHPARDISLLGKVKRELMLIEPLCDLADGCLCILVNEDAMLSLFDSIDLGDTGCVYVVDSRGDCLLSRNPVNSDFDQLFADSSGRIAAEPSAEYFTLRTAGEEMLVNRVLSPDGLTFVSVQPVRVILRHVMVFRKLLLLCFAVALVIGVLLCLRQAHHATTPVASLMNAVGLHDGDSREALSVIRDLFIDQQADLRGMQRVVGEHRTLLRSSFANRLLRGSFSDGEEALHVAEYVIPEHAQFTSGRVLLFHFSEPVKTETDETNLKLVGSIKVALREMLDRIFDVPLTCDPDEETLAMFSFDLDRGTIEAKLDQLLAECPKTIRDCMTVVVGPERHPPFPKLARSFESARTVMTVRLLNTLQAGGQVFYADRDDGTAQFFFPPDMRYRLSESITHGRADDVDSILDELFRVNMSERLMKPAMFRLFVSELICTGVSCLPFLPVSIPEDALDEKISSITGAPLRHQPMLIHEFYRMLAESAQAESDHSEETIRKITAYVAENYQDSSLSLAQIAEEFSINPSTLSTVFKQQTGKNISTFIEDIRIKEAMRLLRTTDWTIAQISEAVGYISATTFCRAFRRNTGYNTSTYKTLVVEE